MKDFNEITSHVLAIDKADDEKAISFYERKKNLEALACKVADELIAGRPVPVFNQAESITRIDGMLTQLANELVSQHDMAIAHRTHLAERLEADGGEHGAKAAQILRAMNAPADSKAALLRAREDGRRALEEDRRIKEAEKRGFYQARDRAFHLILENQGRHPDTIKVSKAFLADLQRDIVHMNKEG